MVYYYHVSCASPPSRHSEVARPTVPRSPSASAVQLASGPSSRSDRLQDRPIDDVVDELRKGLLKQIDEDEEVRLARFERNLRRQLNSGWKPPWKDYELQVTEDEIRKMPTKELGVRLWATGVHARKLLLFDHPNSALRRLEVCYKGYAELFNRPDLWEAIVAGINTCSSQLSASKSDRKNRTLVMSLTTLPEMYGYPPIRKRLAGHEKELIKAHMAALLRVKAFVVAVSSRGSSRTAALITPRTAINLWKCALALGEHLSPTQATSARRQPMSRFKWRKGHTDEDIPRYIDQAVIELRRFVD